jgi:hypothetical protein
MTIAWMRSLHLQEIGASVVAKLVATKTAHLGAFAIVVFYPNLYVQNNFISSIPTSFDMQWTR